MKRLLATLRALRDVIYFWHLGYYPKVVPEGDSPLLRR